MHDAIRVLAFSGQVSNGFVAIVHHLNWNGDTGLAESPAQHDNVLRVIFGQEDYRVISSSHIAGDVTRGHTTRTGACERKEFMSNLEYKWTSHGTVVG